MTMVLVYFAATGTYILNRLVNSREVGIFHPTRACGVSGDEHLEPLRQFLLCSLILNLPIDNVKIRLINNLLGVE